LYRIEISGAGFFLIMAFLLKNNSTPVRFIEIWQDVEAGKDWRRTVAGDLY
jgi:hypothetical protein